MTTILNQISTFLSGVISQANPSSSAKAPSFFEHADVMQIIIGVLFVGLVGSVCNIMRRIESSINKLDKKIDNEMDRLSDKFDMINDDFNILKGEHNVRVNSCESKPLGGR